MNMKRTLTLGLTALAVVGLAACTAPATGEPVQSSGEVQAEYVDQTWSFDLDGTTYEVDPAAEGPFVSGSQWSTDAFGAPFLMTIGAEAPTELEEHRQSVRELDPNETNEPVDYITIEADNREGMYDVHVHSATVYDEDGNVYEFDSAFSLIGDWTLSWTGEYNDLDEYELSSGEWIPREDYRALTNDKTDLYNEHLNSSISINAKGDFLLIGDELPEGTTITAVDIHGSEVSGPVFPVTEG